MALDLDEIEARVRAAQVGPWTAVPKEKIEGWPIAFVGHDGARDWSVQTAPRHASDLNGASAKEDAEFIAAARQDVPALVEEVRKLRAALAAIAQCTGTSTEAHHFASDALR